MSTINLLVYDNDNYGLVNFPKDVYTADQDLKLKARNLNLIKHNPNLFTNRSGSQIFYMVGGNHTLYTTLGCGFLALVYRRKVNCLRQVSTREGIWYNAAYLLFGTSLGVFYSGVFFLRWQVLFNDYFTHYLIKRYKGCDQLNRKNIYGLKDTENTDDCYVFSSSYINNFHM